MVKRDGFTLVEVLITLAVMAILLTLAIVNLRSTQADARDGERQADIENIAVGLESLYSSGYNNGGTLEYPPGSLMIAYDQSANDDLFEALSQKIGQGSLYAPDADPNGPVSLVVATNTTTDPSSVSPEVKVNTYVYQPLTDENPAKICYKERQDPRCVAFNLYYKLENPTDECPDGYCVLRSKHS